MNWLEELKNVLFEKPDDAVFNNHFGIFNPNYKHGMCVDGKNMPEYNAKWFKEYYKEKREELLEYQRDYYQVHKEEKRKRASEYYRKNKEKINEKRRYKYNTDKSEET